MALPLRSADPLVLRGKRTICQVGNRTRGLDSSRCQPRRGGSGRGSTAEKLDAAIWCYAAERAVLGRRRPAALAACGRQAVAGALLPVRRAPVTGGFCHLRRQRSAFQPRAALPPLARGGCTSLGRSHAPAIRARGSGLRRLVPGGRHPGRAHRPARRDRPALSALGLAGDGRWPGGRPLHILPEREYRGAGLF